MTTASEQHSTSWFDCQDSCSTFGGVCMRRENSSVVQCVCFSGYKGDWCDVAASTSCSSFGWTIGLSVSVSVLTLIIIAISTVLYRISRLRVEDRAEWRVGYRQLVFLEKKPLCWMGMRSRRCHLHNMDLVLGSRLSCVTCLSYQYPQPRLALLGSQKVAVKKVHYDLIRPSSRQLVTEVECLRQLRGSPNIAQFVGLVLDPNHLCTLTEYASRGSLRDILNDRETHAQLNWQFRYSLARDIARGMDFIHRSDLLVHGCLSSYNCLVDSHWVCKITDFGLPTLRGCHSKKEEQLRLHKLLWVAPELLVVCQPNQLLPNIFSTNLLFNSERDSSWCSSPFRKELILRHKQGTRAGDVYSYGIILHELLTHLVPYADKELPINQILLHIHHDPKYRPLIPDETPLSYANLVEQCWCNVSSLRPTFPDCLAILRQQREVPDNIVDSMLRQLQEHSTHLEELVEKRTSELAIEKARSEAILYQMIPKKVTQQLQSGITCPAEYFEDVTICFSDIVGFTKIASKLTPLEVIELLSELYSSFDQLLDNHEVYKLGTIGDAYMVAAGVPESIGARHAAECANFALDLLASVNGYRFASYPDTQIQLRIGLHSGPCVAGVVGQRMPHYCLFGDTVNIASRMESSSLALRIQVSSDTARILKRIGGYHLEDRGSVTVKGKDPMLTFWLLGREGFHKPLPSIAEAASPEYHDFK